MTKVKSLSLCESCIGSFIYKLPPWKVYIYNCLQLLLQKMLNTKINISEKQSILPKPCNISLGLIYPSYSMVLSSFLRQVYM